MSYLHLPVAGRLLGLAARCLLAATTISLAAALLASCGGGSGDDGASASRSATIGASGGTLQGPDGVQLTVPPGALSQDVTLTITRSSAGAPAFNDYLSAVANPAIYEITPHGQTFQQPVHLVFPGNAAPDAVVFKAEKDGVWSTVPVTVVQGAARVDVMSLSWFGTVPPGAGACNMGSDSPPWTCLNLYLDKGTILAPPGAVQILAGSLPLALQAGPLTLSFEVKAPYVCGSAQATVLQRWRDPNYVLTGPPVTAVTLMTNASVGMHSVASDPHYVLGTLNVPVNVDASLNGLLTFDITLDCQFGPTAHFHAVNTAGLNVSIGASVPVPAITTQPAAQAVSAGQGVTFSVRATASGTLTAAWQRSNDGGATWSALLAGTPVGGGSDYTFTAAAADQGALFRAQVCNRAGLGPSACTYSNPAVLTVTAPNQAPVVTQQPAAQAFGAVGSARFDVQATGSAPLTYAWTLGGAALPAAPGGTFTQGACSATVGYLAGGASLSLTGVAPGCDGVSVVVTVANSFGTVASSAAGLSAAGSGWQVSTLAGQPGVSGYADGPGETAKFTGVYGVSVDAAGNVYVADSLRIRKVSPAGVVSTLAGSGSIGSSDGLGTAASFYYPSGVALNAAGEVYVADNYNHRIRKISPDGLVTTFAGSGAFALVDGTGSAASFYGPEGGLAVDSAGNVYVADFTAVRKITPTAVVTTVAGSKTKGYLDGTGPAAQFTDLRGICVDAAGNVYVTDTLSFLGPSVIRKITATGVVTTLAGSPTTAGHADGLGTAASFHAPAGLVADAAGRLYVADSANGMIRMVTPAGLVSTVAGSTSEGHADGPGATAKFAGPFGMAMDSTGNLYVGEANNFDLRKLTPSAAAPTVTANAGGGAAGFYSTYVGVPVALDASASTDSLNLPLTWTWDLNGDGVFGDATGARASVQFPSAGTYQVAVRVTDSQGASNTAYAAVVVNDHAPVANPGGPYSGVLGTTIVLDGSQSSDPDLGDTLSYAWDLDGSGQFAGGTTAKVDYMVPGPVPAAAKVCLRVTDASGASAVACTTVVATSRQPPVASAGGGATQTYSGRVNQAIALDATASSDPQHLPLTYSWTANGGGVLSGATSAQPTVSFATAGTYVVTVTVSDGVASSLASAFVIVSP